MSAAAEFAQGLSDQPPRALTLAWRCQQWRALPVAGGLFDQPLAVMTEMETALRVHEAFAGRLAAIRAKKAIEWAEAHPHLVRLCAEVESRE